VGRLNSRAIVATMAAATFSIIYSGNVIAPLVTQLAAEFGTTAGTIGIVAAAYSLPGIATGALAGPFSDRHGRRPFLVGGGTVVGVFTILASLAPDLVTVAILRSIAGVGAAIVLPSMMATVADHFGPERRARIISTVFLANTLGGLAGIALTGVVAQNFGWRVALALAGVWALVAALASVIAPLQRAPATTVPFFTPLRRVLTDRGALALLASNYLGATALQTWALFMVVFFERQYGLARDVASTYALALGIGLLVGTQVGPNFTARLGARGSLAASLVGYGLVLVGLTALPWPLALAVGVLLLAGALYGLRATSNALLMTEQVPDARSTLLGLSATTVAMANATSATAGGIALDMAGFTAIGLLCLITAAASAALVLGMVREVVGAGTAKAAPAPDITAT
jgi:predicted MFS family arabinose efflux permease